MRRKKLRFQTARRARLRPWARRGPRIRAPGRPAFGRAGPRRRLAPRLLILATAVAVAALAWVIAQLLRPVPAMALAASTATVHVLPGVPPRPDWPAQGQAAVGLPTVGLLGTHGASRPQPIASLAKIMTAYVVLRDHPLPADGSGPEITVTPADMAAYTRDQQQGQSVVLVAPGEQLSERQALEAMLIPSGNNVADMLASWDAGSEQAFVAKMNGVAGSLGLRRTRYTSASGADAATVSTAGDQYRLTVRALQIPVFGQIVAMPQVTLPVAGVTSNLNQGLGHDGIVGVKTGTSTESGGCLAFSAVQTVAGRPVTVVGVVLGIQPTGAQPSMLSGVISATENLLGSVAGHLERFTIVKPGAILGSVSSAWATGPDAVAASGVSVTAWPGTPVAVTVTPRPLGGAVHRGQPVAEATVTAGGAVSHVTLIASQSTGAPPVRWLLTRL